MSPWLETLPAADQRELNTSDALAPDCAVLIVGGGLLGLTTAYFLAERRITVQVIAEEPRLGAGSEFGTGALWPNAFALRSSETALHELAQQGRDQWAKFAVRPEFSFDWRVNGLLELCDPLMNETADQRAHRALELGCSVTAVDPEQIAQLEPHVASAWATRGGLHFPSEAHANPVKAAASLVRACRKRGVRLASGVTCTAIRTEGGNLAEVSTSQGSITLKSLAVTTPLPSLFQSASDPATVVGKCSGFATTPQPPLLKVGLLATHPLVQLRSGEFLTEVNEGSPQIPAEVFPELKTAGWTPLWSSSVVADCAPAVLAGHANTWRTQCGIANEFLLAPAFGKLLADCVAR